MMGRAWQLLIVLLLPQSLLSQDLEELDDSSPTGVRKLTLNGLKSREEIEPGRTMNYLIRVPNAGGSLHIHLHKFSGDPILGCKRGTTLAHWRAVQDKPKTDADRWDEANWVKGSSDFKISYEADVLKSGDYSVSVHNWDRYYQDNAIYDIFATYSPGPAVLASLANSSAALPEEAGVQHLVGAGDTPCNCAMCRKNQSTAEMLKSSPAPTKSLPTPSPEATPSPEPKLPLTDAFALSTDWTKCNTNLCMQEHKRLKRELDEVMAEIERYKQISIKEQAAKAASQESNKCVDKNKSLEKTKTQLHKQLAILQQSEQANAKRTAESEKVITEQTKLLSEQMERVELLQKNIKLTDAKGVSTGIIMDELQAVKDQVTGLKSQGQVQMWSTSNKMHAAKGTYPGWQTASTSQAANGLLNLVDGAPVEAGEAIAPASPVELQA